VIFTAVTVTAPVVEVVIVIAEALNVGVELVDAGNVPALENEWCKRNRHR